MNTRLTAYGYEAIRSQQFTRIGDIQLLGKYLFYQDEMNLWSVRSHWVFPTGTQPNPDLAVDIPTGDGRFQWGNAVVYERVLPWDLRWSAFGGVTAQLPHRIERRVPLYSGDPVSPDKEFLTRDWGAMVASGTSIHHRFSSLGILAGIGYNFQFQTKPNYRSGVKFSPERYRYLENWTPAQVLHSMTLVAGFSTVEWYQQKKFVYPFQAQFVYSHPLLGRNVTTNDVFSGELILFF